MPEYNIYRGTKKQASKKRSNKLETTEITLFRKLSCVLREHGMELEEDKEDDCFVFYVFLVLNKEGEVIEEGEHIFTFYSLPEVHRFLVNENWMFV